MRKVIVPVCSVLRILCPFLDTTFNEGYGGNQAYSLEIDAVGSDLELVSQEGPGSQRKENSGLSFIKLVLERPQIPKPCLLYTSDAADE